MDSIAEWLQMGGYALYIWPSYGIAALVLAAMIIFSIRSLKIANNTLARPQHSTNTHNNET